VALSQSKPGWTTSVAAHVVVATHVLSCATLKARNLYVTFDSPVQKAG